MQLIQQRDYGLNRAVYMKPLVLALIAGCFGVTGPAIAGDEQDLIQLLESRQCPACQLKDLDLTHADLRDANLKGAHLQRTNLGQARLDGTDLSKSDLSFTILQGASLRGADLRNSRLIGTDLRGADLTDALLDKNSLNESNWSGAKGVSKGALSHASLHNAGVEAAQAGRWHLAEHLFNTAIEIKPDQPLSWVARGLSRGEQGKNDLASSDFAYAGELFAAQGDVVKAEQLVEASHRVFDIQNSTHSAKSSGVVSGLIGGVLSAAQALAPIALNALMPIVP